MEVIDLLLCIVLVCAGWLAFGWRPGLIFSSGDGLDYVLPIVHFLRDHSANSVYYDPSWIGGAKVAGAWSTPWFLTLALRLGWSTGTALVTCFVTAQIALAFGSLKLVAALSNHEPTLRELRLRTKSALVLLFAFAPMLGWRISAGHFFYPSLLAVLVPALYAGLARGRIGFPALAVIWLAMVACWQTASYQQLISAAYVCFPILFFLLAKLGVNQRAWLVFTALAAASLLWCLPEQAEMWRHFTGGDASRSEHGRAVVYSFLVMEGRDWLGSLFWQPRLLALGRPTLDTFETEFALGPLLFLLTAGWYLNRGRNRLLGGVAALMGIVILVFGAFASHAEPFATIVLWLAYPLQYFRVPMRILYPAMFLALPLALAALDLPRISERRKKSGFIVAVVAALALSLATGWAREAITWALLAALVWPRLRERIGPENLLLPIALAALLGFQARLAKPLDLSQTEANVKELHEKIVQLQPELKNPLVRATLDFQDGKFLSNTGHVLGISTLDGYWQPLRSYNQLTSAAFGVPISPFSLNFHIRSGLPGAFKLFHLYNVQYELRFADGRLTAIPTGAQGEAVRLVTRDAGETPCASGKLTGTEVTDPYFALNIKISGMNGPCRLVVATSFAENIRAYDGRGNKIPTLEVAGGLLGVDVAAGTEEVSLRAEAMAPAWAGAGPWLAGVLLLLAAALSWHPLRRAE